MELRFFGGLSLPEAAELALEQPVSSRREFLESVCGGDEDLRRAVERLLSAHAAAGRFLSQPAAPHGEPRLEGRPVLARGDTMGYRASKFARRHRVAVGAGSLLVVTLIGGLAATFSQWRRAEANRLTAEARLSDARALANSFLFEFHDAIVTLPGSTAARELVVKRAAQYLDRLSADAPEDVGLKRELAAAYQRLGEAQGGAGEGNLGDTAGAIASYEKALALRRSLLEEPGTPQDVDEMADLEMKMSRVFAFTGDWERAEETARAAVLRLESIAAKTDSDLRGRLGTLYHQLGFIQARRGDEDSALESMRRSVQQSEAYVGSHPDEYSAKSTLARQQIDLTERLVRTGDIQEARRLTESAWAHPRGSRGRRAQQRSISARSNLCRQRGRGRRRERGRRRLRHPRPSPCGGARPGLALDRARERQ